jgi:hypothetical protein
MCLRVSYKKKIRRNKLFLHPEERSRIWSLIRIPNTASKDTLKNFKCVSVRFTGSRFFSLALPGYSAFLFDYLSAANSIIASQEFKGTVPTTNLYYISRQLVLWIWIHIDVAVLDPDPYWERGSEYRSMEIDHN